MSENTHKIQIETMGQHNTTTPEGRGQYLSSVTFAIDNVKADAGVDYIMPWLEHAEWWTSYERPDGVRGEWLPNEFDYFLAAEMIDPRFVAQQFEQSDLNKWRQLVQAGSRPSGRNANHYRRGFDEVASIIKAHNTDLHADDWLARAKAGFVGPTERRVANDTKKFAAAKKTGKVYKAARPGRDKITVNYTRNGESLDVTQADALVRWLDRNPKVRRLVKNRIDK